MGSKVALWVLILGLGAAGMISTLTSVSPQTMNQAV